jgi:MarR family transcriptional regulator, organic hydroperoxide resistance regulator
LAPVRALGRKTRRQTLRLTSEREAPGVGLGVLLRNADMTFNRALRDELARHNITFSQFQHLWQLFGGADLTQVELSRRIGIEAASSTAVLDQLERRKLIRRARDANDRRRINVTLTPAGRALEPPLTDCAVRVNAIARKGFSEREIDLLFVGIQRVVKNLQTRSSRSRS